MSAAAEDVLRWDEQSDASDPPTSAKVAQVKRSLNSIAGLSQLLRVLGALSIIGSMSVFLLQGWQVGNDVQRYLLLLSQTALLTLAGFALSYGLKEAKGARVFFGLALVSVPANFTILGALFYSFVQLDAGLTSYPAFASWQVVDPGSALLTLGGALFALVPLAWLCFSIMARRSARSLTLHFVLLNGLLLMPVRSSLAVGILALVSVAYGLYVSARLFRSNKALNTLEGKFALGVLFVPITIIVMRSVLFYSVEMGMIAMLSMALFFCLRHLATWPGRGKRLSVALDSLSLGVALYGATATALAAANAMHDTLVLPVFSIVLALLAIDLARRTRSDKLATVTNVVTCLFVALAMSGNVVLFNVTMTAIMCAVAGILMVIGGSLYRQRLPMIAGLLMVTMGVLYSVENLAAFFARSGWVELAVIGATVIAAASVLDRHGVTIRLRAQRWAQSVRARVIPEADSLTMEHDNV